LGGTLATSLRFAPGTNQINAVGIQSVATGKTDCIQNVDAVVLAVGSKGIRSIMSQSPECQEAAPELVAAGSLGAIDVVSVRLWLDRYVPIPYPANVFSRFESLQGAGGTFFMLDQLQSKAEQALWGGSEPQGSVIASDFYNASKIALMEDQAIIELLTQQLLPISDPRFKEATVLDSEVQRYPKSVSLFSPGSFKQRPPLETSIASIVCAGDWVRMGAQEHGAKGLCQERAYVCGLEAGNSLLRRKVIAGTAKSQSVEHPVIPIRADEPQVVFGKTLNKVVMDSLNLFGLKHPWLRS